MEPKINLKLAILKHFRTQKEFAEIIGRSELEVSKAIHNRMKINKEEQLRWAQALNSKPERLF